MALKESGKRRVSRWLAAGAAGTAVAAGIGLSVSPAGAATGPSWSTTGPAVSGAVSAVTSIQYGSSQTTEWAFVTTAYETKDTGFPSVWSHTGTEKWAKQTLPGSKAGETFVSATAIGPDDVLAFSTVPQGTGGTGREWQFNGSTWKVIKTFDAPIGGASVTTASNVWVFGAAGASKQLGVWRYNGSTWNQVASTLHGGQSLSYSSAYAYTGSTIAQWNGKTWTGTNLARFIPGTTPHLVDVFDKYNTLYAIGESESTLVVLAYAGHTWTRVGQVNGVAADVNQISSDGGGGIWIPVVDGAKQGAAEVLHYIRSINKLTVTSLPGSALSITKVDGTFELIGGSVPSGKTAPGQALTNTELEYYN